MVLIRHSGDTVVTTVDIKRTQMLIDMGEQFAREPYVLLSAPNQRANSVKYVIDYVRD